MAHEPRGFGVDCEDLALWIDMWASNGIADCPKCFCFPVMSFVVVAALAAQTPGDPDWQTAAGGKMAFDVAEVKPARPDTFILPTFWPNLADGKPPGGRFSGSFPLAAYISFAWKLHYFDDVRPQLPKWANDNYVIDAKAERNPTKDQMRLMVQSLLADRFKLRVHFETRDVPVLALRLVKAGKLGPKLIPHSEGPPCPDSFEAIQPLTIPPPPLPKAGDAFPTQCGTPGQVLGTADGTRLGARDTVMGLLADDIYGYGSTLGEIDKPVVDHTGLQGRFDYSLDLPARMISLIPKPPNPDDPPKGMLLPNAVREQLERSTGRVRRLIVDHVERHSDN